MTTLQTTTDIDTTIGEMVEIIVQGWDPLQIVLFGSRARGDYHDDSDVDLLVVFDQCEDRYKSSSAISAALRKLGTPTDVVVTTPTLFLKRACLVGALERKALIDGRILYVRGGGDPVIEEALHEIQLALEDLGTAERMSTSEIEPPRHSCFHAQQAAEKALKAALELEHNDYPRFHNVNDLRAQLPPSWPVHALDADLDWLSKSAVSARYPEVRELPTSADAVKAVADARLVVKAVAEEFQRRGLELP
ncbi:MAG: HEPN domain-containing protein [Chloroflexota bacterium]|nr:HEPN domain-containing protein [Chloroflexota bacterium]MDE2894294.1 HEPN domain-containing protein [Chloroflexota bacterium]